MVWNRYASNKEKRTKFILEMMKNAMKPYEMSEKYEEEIIGEFENEVEKDFFNLFFNLIKEPKLILDLACGDGRHTAKLCERTQFVVGADLANKNIVKASRKLSNRDNVEFIHASMFNLPFLPDCFNGIWFSQAFEYVPPDFREKFVTQLWSLLKPGGILYMSVETWQHPSLWTTIKELVGDISLFFYWKVIKGKPLIWGEYLYYLPPNVEYRGWHYHVHTSKKTVNKRLKRLGFRIMQQILRDGYIYLICEKTEP